MTGFHVFSLVFTPIQSRQHFYGCFYSKISIMKNSICGSAVNEIEYHENIAIEKLDAINLLNSLKNQEKTKPKKYIRKNGIIYTEEFFTLAQKVRNKREIYERTIKKSTKD